MALLAREHDSDAPTVPSVGGEKPSREQIAGWLAALVDPEEGCVELRAIGVSRASQPGTHVESSFFAPTELDAMARAARGLSGRSKGIYWTLNPVHTDLYYRPDSAAAKDRNILKRRWLLVDCDPVKAITDADTSATSDEKTASLAVARLVRDELRSRAWPEPILADSGNGYHLLYRVDLPNDDASKVLVRAVLTALASRFSTPAVGIDTSVSNASRICKLYGTLAAKGVATAERPHRYSKILDLPPAKALQVAGVEWLEALVREFEPKTAAAVETIPFAPVNEGPPPPPRKGLVARAKANVDPVRAYALTALKNETDAVATCRSNRNIQLNTSAFALGQLIPGGVLADGEVIAALSIAATLCGLEAAEIPRTITNGLTAGKAQPRDLAEIGRANGHGNGHAGGVAIAAADDDRPMEADDDPHRLARIHLESECTHADGLMLRFWLERWQRWDGAAWRTIADAETAGEVTRSIKREFDRLARETSKPTRPVGTKAVGNVLQALRSTTLLTSRQCPRQPAWLDGIGPNPLECLSARNGIIHLPSLIAGRREPMPPTPRFFSANALEYDFDPDAPRPDGWLAFLASLWDDDPESIACLQEWFGYLITPDTRQQKMLLIIGPRRSGKGTILRVLRALVGVSNVAAPTLSGLATNFGAAPLIGKSVAIVPDARLSARADAQVIIERLLSITGEDPQTIDRKHREDWTGDLNTRFAIASNELPRMGDASGALPGRVVLLRLTRSFFGHEDTHLFERMAAELPGICLWAVAGWQRLRERGRFLQPASGQVLLDELDELSSPVATFVAERCVTGSECRVAIKELYAAWKTWCEGRGKDHPGDEQGFGRNLRAVLPRLESARLGSDGSRVRIYKGLELKEDTSVAF